RSADLHDLHSFPTRRSSDLFIRSEGSHQVASTLKTMNKSVFNGKRFELLETLLAKPVAGGTILFTNTRDQCDKLARQLEGIGKRSEEHTSELQSRENLVCRL